MTLLAFALFLQDAATQVSTDPSLGPPPAGQSSSALVEMLHNSGPTALTVLALLLVMSVVSWAVMISKWRSFKAADTQNRRFIRAFRKSGRLSEIAAVADQFKPSPLVAVFNEIHDEYQRQTAAAAFRPILRASSALPRPPPAKPSAPWNAA